MKKSSQEKFNQNIAVILAAGKGQRLGGITKNKPKPLLEVGGKPLIEHAINFIKNIGIENLIVVGGYHFNQLEKKVKQIDPSITVVENKEYECQNLLSLAKALPLVENRNLLVCNSDYVFKKITAKAVANNLKDIAVYCSFDLSGDDEDVMKVKIDKRGNMIEMSKQLADFQAIYTGVFFFESKYISELKKITAEVLESNKEKATVEWLFKEFIKKGHNIKVVDIGKADWYEIDTAEELEQARQELNNN
ncbi:NTP transferase domain-containing protein [Candidatus Parcubacteria bacterium]|nr:NTP transferase domain-containing protein [Candidatus Parcubacteria bacterium]